MNCGPARNELSAALTRIARSIRSIEEDALKALHEQGNQEAYREGMREKANVLRDLPRAMASFLERMDESAREAVEDRLDRFAQGAATALRLGSVFYMSALLYPEDHKEGEPNDLERFIAELEGGTFRG